MSKQQQLQNINVFIGIPTYDGNVHFKFTLSLINLIEKLKKMGVSFTLSHNMGSLVNRCRNQLVSIFMASKCTHMLFLDSDIYGFENSIEKFIYADKDLVGGIYPIKQHNYNVINKYGLPVTRETLSKELSFNINLCQSYDDMKRQAKNDNGIVEIRHLPGGCLFFSRKMIEQLAVQYPDRQYFACSNESTMRESDKYLYDFFASFIINNDHGVTKKGFGKQYLSEDYGFCELWKQMGKKVYADITTPLGHCDGKVEYYGSFHDHMIFYQEHLGKILVGADENVTRTK
jgi:hypothetical protein